MEKDVRLFGNLARDETQNGMQGILIGKERNDYTVQGRAWKELRIIHHRDK